MNFGINKAFSVKLYFWCLFWFDSNFPFIHGFHIDRIFQACVSFEPKRITVQHCWILLILMSCHINSSLDDLVSLFQTFVCSVSCEPAIISFKFYELPLKFQRNDHEFTRYRAHKRLKQWYQVIYGRIETTRHKNQQDPPMLNGDPFWFKTDTSLKNSVNKLSVNLSFLLICHLTKSFVLIFVLTDSILFVNFRDPVQPHILYLNDRILVYF